MTQGQKALGPIQAVLLRFFFASSFLLLFIYTRMRQQDERVRILDSIF